MAFRRRGSTLHRAPIYHPYFVPLATIGGCFLGLIALLIIYLTVTEFSSPYEYLIAIDAGSTRLNAILFRWPSQKLNGTGQLEQVAKCRVKDCGIAALADNDKAAQKALTDCVKTLSRSLDRAARNHKQVPVFLGATSSIRLAGLYNTMDTDQLLTRIQASLERIGPDIKACIIKGTEEAMYAWIAANYVAKTILASGQRDKKTLGIVNIGSVSAQSAVEVFTETDTTLGSTSLTSLQLFGKEYTIERADNLCFGVDESFRRYLRLVIESSPASAIIEVPCLPAHFIANSSQFTLDTVCNRRLDSTNLKQSYTLKGTGNYEQCRRVIREQLLDRASCEARFQYCAQMGFAQKDTTYYATGAYYHVVRTMKLDSRQKQGLVEEDQYLETNRNVCQNTVEALQTTHSLSAPFALKYCFTMTYLHATLASMFHFSSWTNLRFLEHINQQRLGWIVGMALLKTNVIPPAEPPGGWTHSAAFYLVPGAILLFVIGVASGVALQKWIVEEPSRSVSKRNLSIRTATMANPGRQMMHSLPLGFGL